jgi:hypothetical protein
LISNCQDDEFQQRLSGVDTKLTDTLAKSLLENLSNGRTPDEYHRLTKLIHFYLTSSRENCELCIEVGLVAALVGPLQFAIAQGIDSLLHHQ